jgi:predicted anti-sigma-YlaC factor YlaD
MQEHPTAIELELARTGEAEEAVAEHLEVCAECRSRLGRLEALAAELDRPLEPLAIPVEREQAVLELAVKRAEAIRRQSERRPRRPLRKLAWAVPLAAAAAVALFFLVPGLQPAETPVASEAAAPAGLDDVNQDGRVDMLDAFALARAIEDNPEKGTREDVERVAMTAVAIAPRGGAR